MTRGAQGPPPDVSPQVEGGSECSHGPVSCVRMTTTSTPDSRKLFIRKLLAWYRRAARDLPWRTTRNPYAILVSEFMLQQTQVSRVLDFYPRFLKRFPTIETLARARPKAVMEQWDGLGYYARARNLHDLAKGLSATGYRLPDDPDELQKLPGVGRYTAGAVACFAYEKAVPAVDTNVKRVLERAFAPRDVWAFAGAIVPRPGKTAWKFNQALMELGALVCKARNPSCPECPVRTACKFGLRRRGETPSRRAAQRILGARKPGGLATGSS
jgi:A/G-specific adenine glycosylase